MVRSRRHGCDLSHWISIAMLLLETVLKADSYLYGSVGNLAGLSDPCLREIDRIFNDRYLLSSTNPSQDERESALFLTPARRLGCRLSLVEALEQTTNASCPPEQQLIDCFWVSHDDWVTFNTDCPLFRSQVPPPGSSAFNAGRKLLQGPAHNEGILTWKYSNGEAAGLQYDHWSLPGTRFATPPIDQALALANEGSEGEGGPIFFQRSLPDNAEGCFPGMWSATDFKNYLHGNLTEASRPKEMGSVSAG